MYNQNGIQNHQILEIESNIGYTFGDKKLLFEALSHPSLNSLNISSYNASYERLEFLGDSILNFIITDYLVEKFDTLDEGKLSKMRAYIVSKNTIYKLAQKINISDYLMMTKGEEKTGGRTNISNLENVIEALIGAIYKDSNISVVREWILKIWKQSITESMDKSNMFDPKSTLQEFLQSKNLDLPIYEILSVTGKDHSPCFNVRVTSGKYKANATGGTKKEAQKQAAQKLYSLIHKSIL